MRVLKNIRETKSNMWIATTKYYIEYFAVYSVLMKLGIKCEIHDCTIELVKFLEDESIIEKGTSNSLDRDKELRIDNQYYLKNKPIKIDFKEISSFLLSIKNSLDKLNREKNRISKEKDKCFLKTDLTGRDGVIIMLEIQIGKGLLCRM